MRLILASLSTGLLLSASVAQAEYTFRLYSGVQGALESDASGRDTDGTRFSFDVDWEGNSMSAPPYYGLRVTRWRDDNWGLSLDFTHSKLYANDDTLASSGFDRLEFTDGLNVLSLALERRFPISDRLNTYAGAGIGVALPHVEIESPAATERTFEYQFGGPALVARAGVDYALSPRWSAFAEVEIGYVWLDVDIKGGGSFETDIATHAVNIGVQFALP